MKRAHRRLVIVKTREDEVRASAAVMRLGVEFLEHSVFQTVWPAGIAAVVVAVAFIHALVELQGILSLSWRSIKAMFQMSEQIQVLCQLKILKCKKILQIFN